ncbi:hypothetical protein FQN54_003293 [Arachnomyces sp. PD_36]|nr:hypothetical protein FQN54_003293 [Arachnomyces sp. PD_36]
MAPLRASLSSLVLGFLSLAPVNAVPAVDYDAIIVGGGPAGLSALSGLSRVRNTALLFDSGVYRNGLTRHMHDVIGNDGTVPSEFRGLAREQIAKYDTAEIRNATVTSIEQKNQDVEGEAYFEATDDAGELYTARKVVIATGMKDILPSTPGIDGAWSRGIYWCPWCDGYEHRDQPFGILGAMNDILDSVIEIETVNDDIIAFVNGTHTPEEVAQLDEQDPTWSQQLEAYNVQIENRTIASIERLQDGSVHNNPAEHLEFDLFKVHFTEGPSVDRGAFISNFPSEQYSTLPAEMGLKMDDVKIEVNPSSMRTNIPGVWAVGDCNNDGSTNVPHAMFTGKKAAVYVHVEIAREDAKDLISERDLALTVREMEDEATKAIGNDFEELWGRAQHN